MKKSFDEADELDGFEELNDDDQEKIRQAWKEGHVAEEDVPESAQKPAKDADEVDDEDEEDAKPAKKKAAAKAPKKAAAPEEPGAFKLDYAPSSRSKCKGTLSIGIATVHLCSILSCHVRRLRWYVLERGHAMCYVLIASQNPSGRTSCA